MALYAISRLQSYKFTECGAILKEALRTLPNYDNPDCDPAKSHLNVPLIECSLDGLTLEKYILKFRKENDIKGRFNTNATNPKNLTNVLFQALFTASPDAFNGFSRDDIIAYYRDCLSFFKEEFPDVPILSAVIHFDETTPHMHVTALPVVERYNKRKDVNEKIFSTTKLMPGKDYFRGYQDRFFAYMDKRYSGLTRGHSDRKNMSVETYKKYRELEKKYFESQQKVSELYAELHSVNESMSAIYSSFPFCSEPESWIECIPLLGLFFSALREMNEDDRRRELERALRQLERERRSIHSSLDDAIDDANALKPIYNASKRSRKIDKIR